MKKPEPPKEFDEEIVLAKVRISNREMGWFYSYNVSFGVKLLVDL